MIDAEVKEGGKPVSAPPRPPHLLGFTATPAGGSTVEAVRSKMASLLSFLSAGIHIILDDRLEGIAVPPVEEKEQVEARDEDVSFIHALR